MRKFLTTAATAMALAGTLVAAAAPADAQRYRGGYGRYHRGGGGGGAVVAGILGLGVGAAIASSNRGYNRGYYDRGYAPGYYYAPPPPPVVYYAPPPPPAYYYGGGYGGYGRYGY